MTSLIDSHCHLDGERFAEDRSAVIERARAAGVELMLAIGTGDGPPDLEAGIRLAEAYPFIYATVGVHPHEAAKVTEETWPALIALTAHPKCVAVGEIGLDYHYDFSPRDVQQRVFVRQMEIARAAGQPIIIHTREAWADTVTLIREHWAVELGGIFHCFSGGPAEAQQALDLGFHVSFSGIVTFPKATEIHEAARMVPADRILVETDAPYLAPIPYRGKRNEPAYVVETAKRVAELRGVSFETLAEQTTENWRRLCLQVGRRNG
ncbi:TatD family hydrolase [uncultured Paludibaculum sp.]|uniref:TatD family hydrolase n=1 Tax=uncultured Paludibaculum sp. TaxID=1765020 RepID=UPI002AAAC993|nr:TatD family hydrolase [uncultured Paludibaculum sp.]